MVSILDLLTQNILTMNYKIIDVEGIGDVYAKKLIDADINTIEELLEKCAKPAGRKELAELQLLTLLQPPYLSFPFSLNSSISSSARYSSLRQWRSATPSLMSSYVVEL